MSKLKAVGARNFFSYIKVVAACCHGHYSHSPALPQPHAYLMTEGHNVFQTEVTVTPLTHIVFTVFFTYTNSL